MRFIKSIFGRFIINTLLVIGQVALIAYFISVLSERYIYVFLVTRIIAYLVVVLLVNKKQNPNLKIPWIVFILITPIAGVIGYLAFGKQFFPKRRSKKYLYYENLLNKYLIDDSVKIDDKYVDQSNYLKRVSNFPMTKNNKLKYYSSGEDIYKDLIEDIKNAKEYIFLEFFIFSRGQLLNELLDILKVKVKEGVDVRIIYDDIGSVRNLNIRFNKKVAKMGIKCLKFHPFIPFVSSAHNNRDHRKIIVIDGVICYTGGINIADEYINLVHPFGYWKDNGLKIQGDAVNSMLALFLTTWNANYKEKDQDFDHFFKKHNIQNDVLVQPFGDGPKPIYNEYIGENAYLNIINSAKKYLYITTPYLIVDYTILNQLKSAAKRGVDVRIIVPHIPDKKIFFWITQSNYRELVESGVKVYEYTPGFIHSKYILVDDEISILGTINFDYRSLVHHFECASLMLNLDIYDNLKNDFINVMNASQEKKIEDVKKVNIFKRLIVLIFDFFSPLL